MDSVVLPEGFLDGLGTELAEGGDDQGQDGAPTQGSSSAAASSSAAQEDEDGEDEEAALPSFAEWKGPIHRLKLCEYVMEQKPRTREDVFAAIRAYAVGRFYISPDYTHEKTTPAVSFLI